MRLINSFLVFCILQIVLCVGSANDDALTFSGKFIQGGLVIGQAPPESTVIVNDHPVRVSKQGKFIIGFGRDYPDMAMLTIMQDGGSTIQHTLKIAQREYNVQRINGLPNAQVNPDEKTLLRIKEERKRINAARSLDDERVDFLNGFIWPTKGPITGVYGSQRILNGEPRQPHYGIDVAAPVGTLVVAPAGGLVTYAEEMYFSGGTLVLDHGHHLSSSFLHLDEFLVQVGDYVQQGEKIARVGKTGRVTGSHLDWRMNWHDQRIDPGLLMEGIPNK